MTERPQLRGGGVGRVVGQGELCHEFPEEGVERSLVELGRKERQDIVQSQSHRRRTGLQVGSVGFHYACDAAGEYARL